MQFTEALVARPLQGARGLKLSGAINPMTAICRAPFTGCAWIETA